MRLMQRRQPRATAGCGGSRRCIPEHHLACGVSGAGVGGFTLRSPHGTALRWPLAGPHVPGAAQLPASAGVSPEKPHRHLTEEKRRVAMGPAAGSRLPGWQKLAACVRSVLAGL